MVSLALALYAGSYGLHKLPEDLNDEDGLLLIHRSFALTHSFLQFSSRGPIGLVGHIAVRTVRYTRLSPASGSGQVQQGRRIFARAYCVEHPTANKHDSPASTARFSICPMPGWSCRRLVNLEYSMRLRVLRPEG